MLAHSVHGALTLVASGMAGEQVLDVSRFRARGFARLDAVFAAAEIAALRRAVLDACGIGDDGPRCADRVLLDRDLLSVPRLRDLVVDPRILAVARAAVGDMPVYFGMSKVMVQWQRHWVPYHRDNVDAMLGASRGPDWADDYTISRIGLYLQDHRVHAGSLWLREGSHRALSAGGRAVPLATAVGDIGVWSFRASHGVRPLAADARGIVARLPDLPGAIAHRLVRPFTPSSYRYWPRPRIFIHMVFARDDRHLSHLLHHVPILRQLAWVHAQWKNAHYDDEIRRCARARGLAIRTPGQAALGG